MVLDHPDRVAGLAICDARYTSTEEHKMRWAERVAKARETGMVAIADDHLAQWFTPAVHEAQLPALDAVRAMIAGTPLEGYAGCVNAVTQTDFAGRLGEIRNPAIFICGARDIGDFVEHREIHRRIRRTPENPSADFLVLDEPRMHLISSIRVKLTSG